MNTSELIVQIVGLEAFEEIFKELKQADPKNGPTIEKALRACLEDGHNELIGKVLTPERIRYLLFREAVEIKAQASTFLNYEREMASREAALWRFALGTTEGFFELVADALAAYFKAKSAAIVEDVENSASWYSNLTDTAKKSGKLINLLARPMKEIARRVSKYFPDKDSGEVASCVRQQLNRIGDGSEEGWIDTRDVVKRAIERHIPQDVLIEDVQTILAEAGKRYEHTWEKEVSAQTPDLSSIRTFAAGAGGQLPEWTSFELGPAEQTLAIGLGGAAVGTLSLAAGWHVLAYSMVHVFYPVALVAALACIGVAYFTKSKSQEKRRKKVAEAIEQYHRHFLIQIDLGKPEGLQGKTMRQAMAEQAEQLVVKTLDAWRKAISGDLTMDHYRQVNSTCTRHLQLIQDCMATLPEDKRAF